jgi:hypothetical protein
MPATISFNALRPKKSLRSLRPNRVQKIAAAGLVVAAGTAALTGTAIAGGHDQATPTALPTAQQVAYTGKNATALTTLSDAQSTALAGAEQQAKTLKATADQHTGDQAASRSADRGAAPAAPKYGNNLDGWIHQALDIMHDKGIPGTYDGLHRNIMRESSGNPNAVNDWDINAVNGIPSKGLLQVIQPTFEEFHVDGTAHNLTDPVANITAAANYAAHRYGSIDNVNSAY